MKTTIAFAVLLLAAPAAEAQEPGDWALGIAVGTGERAGLFVRYYPAADIGAEAHVLLVPIFDLASAGAGAGVVAHPLQDDRIALYLGGSMLGTQYLGGAASRRGFSLGLGYEPLRGDEFTDLFMGRLSLSLARRVAYGNEARHTGVEDGVWGPWRLRPGGQIGWGGVAGGLEDEDPGIVP